MCYSAHSYKKIFVTTDDSTKSMMQSTEPSFAAADLGSLPQEIRQELLGGPALLLIVTNTCEPFDYLHQCSAAKDMVSSDRMRRLVEQSESNARQSHKQWLSVINAVNIVPFEGLFPML
jgi:hypothetical protein